MKTPEPSLLNLKCEINGNKIGNKTRRNQNKLNNSCHYRSFFQLSLSFVLSLWCCFFLFSSRFGLSHENKGGSQPDNPSVIRDPFRSTTNDTADMVFDLNNNYSLPQNNRLQDMVWRFSGFSTDLVCDIHQEETNKPVPDMKTPPYFDEFRQEKSFGVLPSTTTTTSSSATSSGGGVPTHHVNITHRLEPDGTEYNYASSTKGAKVVSHNKEAKGASNILGKDRDKYLRNPCSVDKFVVMELAEETLVDAVNIANFEHYSSNFKELELSGSLVYPTETWFRLGQFVASNVKHIQTFKLSEPKWSRYLKLNLLTHYGSEHYCTLSVVKVYGVDAIERMLEDLFEASEEHVSVKTVKLTDVTTVIVTGKPEPNTNTNTKTSEVQNGTDDVRQHHIGRMPGDTVLKILTQKVRSVEQNLSVLEDYIKEMSRRRTNVVPELEKELTRISMVVENGKDEIKDLVTWKETMEKGLVDLESWKGVVSSQVDVLLRENNLMRLDIEKIVQDQASFEYKEVVVLLVSLSFMCIAVLTLISSRVITNLRTSQLDKIRGSRLGFNAS